MATTDSKAWDDRRQIWRNYFGRQMYTVTDAGYYLYRDLIMMRLLRKWLRQSRVEVGSVLDFGCGTGDTVAYLARAFPGARILGVDISPFMIEKARERQLPEDRVAFREIEGEGVDAPPCDLIMIAMVLQHNDDARVHRIFRDFARLLNPGGRVMVMESVVPPEHEKSEGAYLARSAQHYEELMTENGLTVERSHLLSSPVYRRVAPYARRIAESVAAAAAASPKARMSLVDMACTPAVIATYATDPLLSKDAGWGYKLWWLKRDTVSAPGS
jgi:SAM-dependent methyltransferase